MRDEPDGDRLGIGDFAIVTGLSVPRLRRYHDLGLLVPAHVDELTGYRSYTSDQIDHARAIRRLREIDLPLEEVATALGGDRVRRLAVLQGQRRRLQERLHSTHRMVDLVDRLIREEHTAMTTSVQLMEVVLKVEDIDATVAFYQHVLGFEFQPDDHKGTAPLHYDACGGAWDPEGFFLFTIYPAGDAQPTTTMFGFGVPDVDYLCARAEAHDAGQVLDAPADHGSMPRAARLKDPAGNVINLYQRAGNW